MADEKNFSIAINLSEKSFSINGSEAFIEKYLNELKTYINEDIKTLSKPIKTTDIIKPPATQTTPVAKANKYIENGIYYIDEQTGEIKILKPVPGTTKAAKAKNVAMILLYAKNDEMTGSEIIPHCEEQACYDMANFSAIFKKKDGCLIRKGSGANWSIKLTIPGRKAAEEILESMV